MGRYAFFNTGLEYKFMFAVQDSYDITRFGGMDLTDTVDHPAILWKTEDALGIRAILIQLNGMEPDWSLYERSIDGTERLRQHLRATNAPPRYALGCIIYHQLLYSPILTATYEL